MLRNKDGPVTKVTSPEFEKRTAQGVRPWLHNKCKTRESEALIMVLTGHTGDVKSCAFSPDGKTLASANFDNTVRLRDAAMGKLIEIYPCIGDLRTISFNSSGRTIATGDDGGNVYILEFYNFDLK